MKNKQVGNLLIAISIIVGLVFLIFGISASVLAGKSILLTTQVILGLLMFLGIAFLGSSIRNIKERKFTNLPEIEIIKFDTAETAYTDTPIREKIKNAINETSIIKESVEESSPIIEEKPKKVKIISEKDLNDDEKKVIKFLKKAEENEMLQSDLVKKTKVTKVKMTRILKKLEEKELILKKKVGMTNIIILK